MNSGEAVPIKFEQVSNELKKWNLSLKHGGTMRKRTYIVEGTFPGIGNSQKEFKSLIDVQYWLKKVEENC